MRRLTALGLAALTAALLTAALASSAWACPACATREGPGTTVLTLVAAMIALPYAVAMVAIRVVRNLERGPRPDRKR